MSWDDVRLFLALCRARTVGEAGRSLVVDASTVSRRLAALEEALSATLFDRGRAGISPTAAAENLMPVAEQIEEAMARFTEAADALEHDVSGLVRITCPADVADVIIVPLLPELLRRHPSLRLELDSSEAIADLTRREADIALRVVRPERGDLVVTQLLAVPWILAASPKLGRELGTLRAWSDAPWVGWGERFSQCAPARWRTIHVPEPEPAVRSDSLRVQLAMAAAGIGVALVPEGSIEQYGLVPIKISKELRASAAEWPTDQLYLVTHRALRQVPRVRAVWDLLVERVGGRG